MGFLDIYGPSNGDLVMPFLLWSVDELDNNIQVN